MRIGCKLTFLLALYALNAFTAHAQQDVCKVMASFVEDKAGSSSSFQVGKFNASIADGTVTRSFLHEESGINIQVGVSYYDDVGKRIKLAVAFTGKPDLVFYEEEAVQAEASHGKGWTDLYLRKRARVKNRIYTFTLLCEKEQKARIMK